MYDISKTFKTDTKQLEMIKEIEEKLKLDQSRAIRFMLNVGYAGIRAVQTPEILDMKDAQEWKIPLFEVLSPETRKATLELWEKELGKPTTDRIRRLHDLHLESNGKGYEVKLKKEPMHITYWGSGVTDIPIAKAREMLKALSGNTHYISSYVEMAEHMRKYYLFNIDDANPKQRREYLWAYLNENGLPNIVQLAKRQKIAAAKVGASTT